MARPIDSLIQTQRLELVRRATETLGEINVDISTIPVTQLEDYRERLDAIQVELRQFTRLGDQQAFIVYRQIDRLLLKIEYNIQKALVQRSYKRTEFLRGNSTLQFIAEDELGDKKRWTDILKVNPTVRYSADLVGQTQVRIP